MDFGHGIVQQDLLAPGGFPSLRGEQPGDRAPTMETFSSNLWKWLRSGGRPRDSPHLLEEEMGAEKGKWRTKSSHTTTPGEGILLGLTGPGTGMAGLADSEIAAAGARRGEAGPGGGRQEGTRVTAPALYFSKAHLMRCHLKARLASPSIGIMVSEL